MKNSLGFEKDFKLKILLELVIVERSRPLPTELIICY